MSNAARSHWDATTDLVTGAPHERPNSQEDARRARTGSLEKRGSSWERWDQRRLFQVREAVPRPPRRREKY